MEKPLQTADSTFLLSHFLQTPFKWTTIICCITYCWSYTAAHSESYQSKMELCSDWRVNYFLYTGSIYATAVNGLKTFWAERFLQLSRWGRNRVKYRMWKKFTDQKKTLVLNILCAANSRNAIAQACRTYLRQEADLSMDKSDSFASKKKYISISLILIY